MENTSGMGKDAAVPAEIDRWNWGAFLLGWVWGIGNKTYIAFLGWVPWLGMLMMPVLGVKGSAWAWRNRRWDSVEHFRQTQRRWAKWGAIVWGAAAFVLVAGLIVGFSMVNDSEAYKLTLETLRKDERIAERIGKPFETGMPTAQYRWSGQEGKAEISFDITGAKGKGRAYARCEKTAGTWRIVRLAVQPAGKEPRIDLVE